MAETTQATKKSNLLLAATQLLWIPPDFHPFAKRRPTSMSVAAPREDVVDGSIVEKEAAAVHAEFSTERGMSEDDAEFMNSFTPEEKKRVVRKVDVRARLFHILIRHLS